MLTQISKSRYCLTSNNSKMVPDGAILTTPVSRIWSIFQRPWTTSSPDFKVKPLFDAEYLRNVSLPDYVVMSDTINTFKNRLDAHWKHRDFFISLSTRATYSGTEDYNLCLSIRKLMRVCGLRGDAYVHISQWWWWWWWDSVNSMEYLHTPYRRVTFLTTLSDLAKYSMTQNVERFLNSLRQPSFMSIAS